MQQPTSAREASTLTESHANPEPVILIIADISGYTRYMTANAKSLAHSQAIITELVCTIIKQAELPLEVAKLEGDAVFFYARKGAGSWTEIRKTIGSKLFSLFDSFTTRLKELSHSTTCTCNACTHIEKLALKLIVHSGEALFYHVLQFRELAGPDVILVHRLLKNSVPGDHYLLLTEAARHDLELPDGTELQRHSEEYEEIGSVKAFVYYPDKNWTILLEPVPEHRTLLSEYGQTMRWQSQLWFAPLVPVSDPRQRHFEHIEATTRSSSRAGFALLTLILTPIYLPVSALFSFLHTMRQRSSHTHKHHDACGCMDGSESD